MLCVALPHIYKTNPRNSMGLRSLISLKIYMSPIHDCVMPSSLHVRNLPSELLIRFRSNSVIVQKIQQMIWWGEPNCFSLVSLLGRTCQYLYSSFLETLDPGIQRPMFGDSPLPGALGPRCEWSISIPLLPSSLPFPLATLFFLGFQKVS